MSTTTAESTVLLQIDGPIARLSFNRPEVMNAINLALAADFRRACETLVEASQVRVVVLAGVGRAFMAGGDISEMQTDPLAVSGKLIRDMHRGIELLAGLPVPVIASLHGAVAGAGMGVALACDLALASQDTRFALAYPAIGTSADCATSWALPRVVGLRTAMRIALFADPFDAAQALQWGLVNEVVPAQDLARTTDAWAARLAAGAPTALAQMKSLLRASLQNSLQEQLGAEEKAFATCAATADFQEGLNAFHARRPARFGSAMKPPVAGSEGR